MLAPCGWDANCTRATPLVINIGADERKHSVTLDTQGWFPGLQLSPSPGLNIDLNGGTPLKIHFSLGLGLLHLDLGIGPMQFIEEELHATLLTFSSHYTKAPRHESRNIWR